jgi:hypothetical protein
MASAARPLRPYGWPRDSGSRRSCFAGSAGAQSKRQIGGCFHQGRDEEDPSVRTHSATRCDPRQEGRSVARHRGHPARQGRRDRRLGEVAGGETAEPRRAAGHALPPLCLSCFMTSWLPCSVPVSLLASMVPSNGLPINLRAHRGRCHHERCGAYPSKILAPTPTVAGISSSTNRGGNLVHRPAYWQRR